MKSANSTYVYNGLGDNGQGTGNPWAVAAQVIAIVGPIVFGSGGDDPADNRKRKRQALQALGFRWDWTKGYQQADYDNIDGFDDAGLDNMATAYNKHGNIVADLHNQGLFNKDNARNMSQVEQIIQQNGGGTSLLPGMNWGGGGSGDTGTSNQAGFNYMPFLVVGGVVLTVSAAVSILKQQPPQKRK